MQAIADRLAARLGDAVSRYERLHRRRRHSGERAAGEVLRALWSNVAAEQVVQRLPAAG
jgi:hypothetical protein